MDDTSLGYSGVLFWLIDWLINYCLIPSEQYLGYIQDENKFNNICNIKTVLNRGKGGVNHVNNFWLPLKVEELGREEKES
jgi:hypothetical protein